ncbi:MAG: kelch repeat-containing protein, partial [Planctomycetota bacterium]
MNAIRNCKIVVVAALLGAASVSLGAGDTWTEKAPMPTARALLSTSVVDGKIYAIGGRQYSSSSASSTVEQYDPATDTWTTKAPMPTARQWLSTSAVNGKIYAFGGTPRTYQPAFSTVEEYDPATDTWTEKASMPTARFVHSSSVVDGKIYVIGGGTRNGAERTSSDVEAYDPATDTWTRKAPMPTARMFLTTSVVNGKIYAIGGATAAGGTNLSTVEEYDPVTDTWTTKASMPTRRGVAGASAVNGIIYVIGGGRFGGTVFSTVEAYDPTTDTWTEKTPMPTARLTPSTSAVDGKIYAIGGALNSSFTGTSTVEEYDTGLIVASPDYVLVQGSQLHGANGVFFDSDDRLYIACGFGQEIVVMDKETGEILDRLGPDVGVKGPDDLTFGPGGSLYWTDIGVGEVGRLSPDGVTTKQFVAPGVNPITFSDDGRLFTALCFLGDALYELDPDLVDPPRLIVEGPGMLNAFDFGPDGFLYSPAIGLSQVVRINVDTGEITPVIEGIISSSMK